MHFRTNSTFQFSAIANPAVKPVVAKLRQAPGKTPAVATTKPIETRERAKAIADYWREFLAKVPTMREPVNSFQAAHRAQGIAKARARLAEAEAVASGKPVSAILLQRAKPTPPLLPKAMRLAAVKLKFTALVGELGQAIAAVKADRVITGNALAPVATATDWFGNIREKAPQAKTKPELKPRFATIAEANSYFRPRIEAARQASDYWRASALDREWIEANRQLKH